MTPGPKAREQTPTVPKEPRPGSLRARVLLAIRRACAEKRAVAYAELARASGIGTGTAGRACHDLRRCGLIAIERRRGRGSEHRFIDSRSGAATAWSGGGWGGARGHSRAAKRGIRACLTCGPNFRSAGIRNRMCRACRVETADYDVSSHRFYGKGEL